MAKIKKNKDYKTLNIDGDEYKTKLTKKFENREVWEKPNEKLIKSFIPGTILEVYVDEGEEIEEGKNMLILEAMKLKNKVYAPITGKIKSINVKAGDLVPKNHILIEFE